MIKNYYLNPKKTVKISLFVIIVHYFNIGQNTLSSSLVPGEHPVGGA